MISQTEENYLKAIYKISEYERDVASTNRISKQIKTTAASVTDMLKRLSEKELINYEKYKGVSLTTKGNTVATGLIRKHRLWETFLVDILKFNWEEVHDMAEQLEHINSQELVNRLDEFLAFPKYDPHGDPIPNAQGKFTLRNQIRLSSLKEGESGVLLGVRIHDRAFLKHLADVNIELSTHIEIKRKFDFDQSLNVLINNKEEVKLSEKVAMNLWMKKTKDYENV